MADRTPIEPDGYGQSIADDLRSLWRFRSCKRRTIHWSTETELIDRACTLFPEIERFGDLVHAAAQVDGRIWIVMESIWHGWPDRARFAFFALDPALGSSGRVTVWAAADFHEWPAAWTSPDTTDIAPGGL